MIVIHIWIYPMMDDSTYHKVPMREWDDNTEESTLSVLYKKNMKI